MNNKILKKEKKYFNFSLILQLLLSVKILIIILFIVTCLLAALSIVNLLIFKYVCDVVYVLFDKKSLYKYILYSIGFCISFNLFSILKNIIFTNIKQSILLKLRTTLINDIFKFKYEYFITIDRSKLVDHLVYDCEIISTNFLNTFIIISNSIIISINFIFLFYYTNWPFLLLSLFIIILLIVWIIFPMKYFQKKEKEKIMHYYLLDAFYENIINRIKIIKYTLINNYFIKIFNKKIKEIYKLSLYNGFQNFNVEIFISIANWVLVLFILLYGANQLKNGDITFGNFVTYMWCSGQIINPINEILKIKAGANWHGIAKENMNKLLNEIEENRGGHTEFREINKNIKFNNLIINCNNMFFKNINFCINKGEKTAIYDSFGKAKIKIIDLLLRLIESDSSEILIDGKNINSYTTYSLRDNIIFIPQNPYFYRYLKFNNIDIKKNQKYIKIIDIINNEKLKNLESKLPNILYTDNKDKYNFSYKEKYILVMLESLLSNSKFYIFDEPAFFFDSKTKNAFYNLIYNLGKDITTITMTKNMEILLRMDKIFIFKKKKFIELDISKKTLSDKEKYYLIKNNI